MIHLSCKKVRRLWLPMFLMLCAQAVSGQEFTVGEVTYQPRGSGEAAVTKIAIASETGSDTIVIDIPERVSSEGVDYAVTAIGTGDGTSVLQVGEYYKTPVCTIRIPSSVSDVYAGTFSGGNSKVSVEFLPNTNIKSWPVGMFKGAVLNALSLPEGVWTDIPADFCRNTNLKSVILPSNCRNIGDYAFAWDEEDGHTTIGHFKMNYGLQTIGYKAFYRNSPITDDNETNWLKIPSTVTSIGESSFEYMWEVNQLVIPGSIKTIPKRAFANWEGGRRLTISEGVERIEDEAFNGTGHTYRSSYGQYDLGVSIFCLPSTTKYLGYEVFTDSKCLETIELLTPVPPEVNGEFLWIDQRLNTYLYVPQSGYEQYMHNSKYWSFKKIYPLKPEWGYTSVTIAQNIKEGGTVEGDGVYSYGQLVHLSATPAEGYKFEGWLRDGLLLSTVPGYDFYAGNETNIMAVFARKDGSQPSRPGSIYRRIGCGLEGYSTKFGDLSLYRGLQHDPDWKVDAAEYEYNNVYDTYYYNAKGEYRHAHPDKYPAETIDVRVGYDPSSDSYSNFGYIDHPSFPLETELDEHGNLLPSGTFILHVPIVNTKTGERDTLNYTADIYMPEIADPNLFDGLNYGVEQRAPANTIAGQKGAPINEAASKKPVARVIYDGGFHFRTWVAGLDRKNGFDLELTAVRSKDGKTEEVASVKKSYGPGELKIDDKAFESEDYGNCLRLSENTRYVSSEQRLQAPIDNSYDYMFCLRARNYNADGTPRNWVQDMLGEPNRNVKVSELSAWVTSDKIDISKDEETKVDNQKDVQYLVSRVLEGYDQSTTVSSDVPIVVNSYPEWWGDCRLLMDDVSEQGQEKVELYSRLERKKKYVVPFPADGATHRCYLEWPKVGLTRTITFTDYTPQKFSKYRFDVDLFGGGIQNVQDFYMVYETADGEINGKLIKKGEWNLCGGFYSGWMARILLEEDRLITRVISLTDSVPLGTAHVIPIPAKLDNVKSFRSWKESRSANVSTLVSKMAVYGVREINFKLVDATTGKKITENVSVDYNSGAAVGDDGLLKVPIDSYRDGGLMIINADGYVPRYLLEGLQFSGNKVYADGYVGTTDNEGKATITLPMRQRVDDGRPFDILNVYYRTPAVDSIPAVLKTTSQLRIPWTSTLYSGASTEVAYEGGFQPALEKETLIKEKDIPTIAITVAYYDTNLSYKAYPLGGVLSNLKLRAEQSGETRNLYPAYENYKTSMPTVTNPKSSYSALAIYGTQEDRNTRLYVHDQKSKYIYVTYAFQPKSSFVGPEKVDTVYASMGGYEIKVGAFRNLTEDKMYMAADAQTEAPIGEERVGETSEQAELDKFDDAFRNFSVDAPKSNEEAGMTDFDIELPTQGVLLPFNIGVQKINNDIVVRGVASYNFLPGGPVMDLMDKTDMASDIDKVFFDIQRAVTRDKTEYAREDRALGFSTAFVGVRGWLEGRFNRTSQGYYVPRASGMGIKTEASGFLNTSIPSPFFQAGLSLGGELSTYAALEYPDTTGLSWAVDKNAKFFHDVVLHSTVSMNTSLYVGAGLDIYIAKAICGVKGSLDASFDSEVRYRPWLQGARKKYDSMATKPDTDVPPCYTYAGSKMHVGGSIKAYAELKFLWWKLRKEATLASFDKTWYMPDDYTNPLWKEDQNDAFTRKVLRGSVYRPLRLSAAPENTNVILRDIDTYAEPRYIFGGKDVAYYKINADDMTSSHLMFRGGTQFNAGQGEPIVTADVSSTASKGIIAYEVSTASADKIADEQEAPKYMGIKASVNNGSGWTAPVMLTGTTDANYTPRTAIDDSGRAAVVWKGGEFQNSEWGSDVPGFVSGTLYMKRYDGSAWGDAVTLARTGSSSSISDYSVAMLDGRPYMLASAGTENNDVTTFSLSALTYDSDGTPSLMENNGINASCPQIVSFGGKLFGAAIVAENAADPVKDGKKADVHLYNVATNGMIEDLGALGLENRNIADFRLVKSDKAMALIWREYTQVLNETTNQYDMTPSVYGALLRSSADGTGKTVYFLSCPQLIAKATDGLDISFYDAYLPDESSMTGIVTLYDSETGGANVVESTNYFDNDYTIRHAGIDTKVEQGTDYGYYVVVFNEGKDVIDYVDLQLGENGVKHTVKTLIYPGYDAVLADVALYNTDLENGLEPKVTPHFNESLLNVRTYAQAKAATASMRRVNRRAANRRRKAPMAAPKVQLQVVDINVQPLSVHVEGSDCYYVPSADTLISVPDKGTWKSDSMPAKYTTVLVNVINDSPVKLKSDYTTDISLYYDVNGKRPYEYAHNVEIPASEFEANDNSTVARILVGKVPESVTLFAVAHTVDGEGNIVKDQYSVNNASEVFLKKNDLEVVPDGIEKVALDKPADAQPTFDVAKAENGAVVSGLCEGQTLRVYDTTGSLLHLYREKSSGGRHFVRLPRHGVYLFSVGKQSIKLAF